MHPQRIFSHVFKLMFRELISKSTRRQYQKPVTALAFFLQKAHDVNAPK